MEDTRTPSYDIYVEHIANAMARLVNARASHRADQHTYQNIYIPYDATQTIVRFVGETLCTGTHPVSTKGYNAYQRLWSRCACLQELIPHVRALQHNMARLSKGSDVYLPYQFIEPRIMQYCLFGGDSYCYRSADRMNVSLDSGHICRRIESICRPEIQDWIVRTIRAIYATYDSPTITVEDLFTQYLNQATNETLKALLDCLCEFQFEQSALHTPKEHLDTSIARLKKMIMMIKASYMHSKRTSITKTQEHLQVMESLMSIHEDDIAKTLDDSRVTHVVMNPPRALLQELKGSVAERCFQTLSVVFEKHKYPLDMRIKIFTDWIQIHRLNVMQACAKVKTAPVESVPLFVWPSQILIRHDRNHSPSSYASAVSLPLPAHFAIQTDFKLQRSGRASQDTMHIEIMFKLVKVFIELLEHQAYKPLIVKAAIVHSAAMITANEQMTMEETMEQELRIRASQENFEYRILEAETQNTSTGCYSDDVYASASCMRHHPNSVLKSFRKMFEIVSKPNSRNAHMRDVGLSFSTQIAAALNHKLYMPITLDLVFVVETAKIVLDSILHVRNQNAILKPMYTASDQTTLWTRSIANDLIYSLMEHQQTRTLIKATNATGDTEWLPLSPKSCTSMPKQTIQLLETCSKQAVTLVRKSRSHDRIQKAKFWINLSELVAHGTR